MGIKFIYTEERKQETLKIIKKHRNVRGLIMPILQDIQHTMGCVPIVIQKLISQETGVSIAQINSVVTFYSQFSIEPKGKHIVAVCMGTACYVRGSQGVLDVCVEELKTKAGETSPDGNFTVEATRCIGACGLAPIFTVGQAVYGNVDIAKTREVMEELKKTVNEDK